MSRLSRTATSPVLSSRTASARNLGKITAPTLQRVFGNERLFARLDAARFYPVVWVHGPPGAGKTTLAASYLAARGVRPLWCRLDEGDSDPASVFLHLVAAAALCAPGLALPLLQPEFRTALPLYTRRFFRDLFAADGVSVVVLDDYHEVAASAELHDCLPAGLEEVPAGCQVIVISRSAPPSQLARLRLNGRIDVIEPDALRLSPNEIRALAQERGAAPPALKEARIVDATQGWAAGVILMLETPTACPLAKEAGPAPLPEVLFDYFAGEVLQRMEPWAPAVLSALALLPTMTTATAERLTGTAEAGALLEDLYRRNYFTTRDDANEPRYRFHPLFHDFLRSTARRQGRDETLLKIRAASVLDEDGQPDAAVQLLAETGQIETLAGLVKRRAAALVEEGRNDTLIAWLSHFSDAQIADDAWLSHWRGAARLDPFEAYRHHMTALALFEAASDVAGQFAAWAGAASAIRLDPFGDMTRYDPLVVKMRRLLEHHSEFLSPVLELSISASMATALSRRSADRAAFEHWRARANAAAAAVGIPAHSIRLRFGLATIDLLDGNYARATDALDRLPDPFTLDHLPLAQWSGLMAHALALTHRQRAGDLEAFVLEALKRLEQAGLALWLPMQAAFVAMLSGLRNDVATCNTWRKRTAALAEKVGVELGPIYYSSATSYLILSGDFAGAKAEAEKGIAVATRNGYGYFIVHTRVMRASALFAMSDFDEMAEELDRIDAALAIYMADSLALTAMLLRADLNFARGDEAAGSASLSAALAFGRQQGARLPIIYPHFFQRLCQRALDLDIEPAFTRELIRNFGLASADPYDETWPWPIRITTLGGLVIEIDGVPLAFAGKAPRRLLTLVKAIAAYGGRAVPEAKIVDAVWPDEEADAAFNALNIAVHRLRKLLGGADAIVVSNGTIGFDPTQCWLDLWTLEHLLGEAGTAKATCETSCERLVALYKGDVLADDEDLAWARPLRDQWRRRFARGLRAYPGQGAVLIPLLERALTAAPTCEELAQGLMQCHLGQDRAAEGIAAYERLRDALAETSGAAPSPTTTGLYRKLLAAHGGPFPFYPSTDPRHR